LLINEAFTSQENCLTGRRELSSSLNVREVEISNNLLIDRDLNSAINIAKRAKNEIGLEWFNQLETHLLTSKFHKMYIDSNSNLCMKNIL